MVTKPEKSENIKGNVVIGKNNWLFYSNPGDGNNIDDFFKINLFSDAETAQFIGNIRKRLEWCSSNSIKFLFLIGPNKHSVYPEYYPFARPQGPTRTERIMAALPEDIGAITICPLDSLLKNKTDEIPLYFETDTHWNMAGAYVTFGILSNRFKQMFPSVNFPALQLTTDVSFDSSGDIVRMLGLEHYGKRTIPNIHPATGWDPYYQYIKNEETNGVIIKNNDQSLPRAVIFRDSFFSALEPFVSTQFSSAEYNWGFFNDTSKDYILENKPDVIIWEIVERYIPRILGSEWQ
jgi:hypothetical protein